ncbi:MAG: hypothetical protein HYV09_15485 [Deltaproteobacteria bacterium]|nr:hypothetical protein [Deltaproteobacteria bacterium]
MPCAAPFVCMGGACVVAAVLGARCGAGMTPCDVHQGLYCDSTGTCAQRPFAKAGQACDRTRTLCAGGSYCEDGVCRQLVSDGGRCDELDFCQVRSSCQGNVCVFGKVCDRAG